jgi:putative transposase
MCAIRPNVLWALDFEFDQTSNGRTLKLLNVIDEFTRECPAIVVARNIDADGVVACLERLTAESGAPMYLRFDNGPEFIANAVADWCRFNGTRTVFIDPGSPWQNAWIESFNGGYATSSSTATASIPCSRPRCLIEDWRIDYNLNRPHSAHGWLSPNEFARAWTNRHQPKLT